jgi:superfamily II DNA/RNA helicase
VHRIGRTARAGLPGEAISLVSPDETKYLEDIERLLKRKLPRAAAPESLAESRHPARPREMHRERGAAHHRSTPHHETKALQHAKTQHPPKPQPAAGSSPQAFDYTKPYEPSPPKPAQSPTTAPAAHRTHHRPTAALLGGGPAKREPHK